MNKNNPNRTCFCCGKKIYNRESNAYYCKKCSRTVRNIKKVIYRLIKINNIRKINIPKDYDFKISVDVIKKQKW